MPGLGLGERGAVHGREAARPRGRPDHAVGLRRVHPRSGRYRPREARLGDGPQERAARAGSREYVDALPAARPSRRPTRPATTTPCGTCPPTARSRARSRTRSTRRTRANLVNNGVRFVSEGANMPTLPDGVQAFYDGGVIYGPGKAANAGGVAVSGLEMSQNSMRVTWDREVVDERLRTIMKRIHQQCRETAEEYGEAQQPLPRREHRRLHAGGRRDARAGRDLTRRSSPARLLRWSHAPLVPDRLRARGRLRDLADRDRVDPIPRARPRRRRGARRARGRRRPGRLSSSAGSAAPSTRSPGWASSRCRGTAASGCRSCGARPKPEGRLGARSARSLGVVRRGATAVHRLSTGRSLRVGVGSPRCGQPLWGITSV